jgi:NADH-quinone oxidoreductase subunit F
MQIMLRNPFLLLEGTLISSYAIGAKIAFIYIRGEVVTVHRVVKSALADLEKTEIYKKLGIKIILHFGAGAYICGEETALLNSLEGLRGEPRLKPPFPAVEGLYAKPTIVNNVETISTVPLIIQNGATWFNSQGTKGSAGFGIYSVSGCVEKPGQFECEMGITMRELLKMAGGIKNGKKLKFWTPGGSSTPIFTEKQLDVPLSYEDVKNAGSMLGTRALQVFDQSVCVVRVIERWLEFYVEESCGKCTPCREGVLWLYKIVKHIENGKGEIEDVQLLKDVAGQIQGKSFCALGEGAPLAMLASLDYFTDEYVQHIKYKKCPFKN